MKLTRVTITGADDSVNPRELVRLSARYPWVEWGILLSESRQGREPRYPSAAWQRELSIHTEGGAAVSLAGHLCGDLARAVLAGNMGPPAHSIYRRTQLNGFAKVWPTTGVLAIGRALARWMEVECILQVEDLVSQFAAGDVAKLAPNISALWDQSAGRGITGATAAYQPARGMRMGYAGGIGPDNVTQVLRELTAVPGDASFWIDMESKVRSADGRAFHLHAVASVLEQAEPFIVAGARGGGA